MQPLVLRARPCALPLTPTALPALQFTDLNGDLTAFKRYYTPTIRKADELEKKLRFFEEEMVCLHCRNLRAGALYELL